MKRPPLIPLTSVRRSEPALHGPVPAGTAGLLLFRFEGAARFVGSIPVTSLRRDVRACVVAQVGGPSRAQLLEAALFLLTAFRACGCAGVDRSPRACPGRAVCSFLHFAGFGGEGVPAQACAVQPLENSKASTSIFVLQATKSQR